MTKRKRKRLSRNGKKLVSEMGREKNENKIFRVRKTERKKKILEVRD